MTGFMPLSLQRNAAQPVPQREASGADGRARMTLGRRSVAVLACLILFAAFAAHAQAENFQSLMEAAMVRMHRAMMLPGTGDPDRDFAASMIPHHQGAVEMAEAELRFGRDERLRRLAQGIIVEQRQEIAVMRGILEALPPVSLPSATRPPVAIDAQSHPEKDR